MSPHMKTEALSESKLHLHGLLKPMAQISGPSCLSVVVYGLSFGIE